MFLGWDVLLLLLLVVEVVVEVVYIVTIPDLAFLTW